MSGERILVIDDSKEIVKHLCEHVLPTFGYETLYAYDGRTGLQLIQEEKPDMVMLDFQLPEMTGIDILQELAQESITIPVVLMTGYGSELSAIEAFRLGAKDYIIKPFTVDEIIETIERALVETRLTQDKENLGEQLRRLKVEMSRQSNELKTLAKIGTAITSLLDVDKVLERVLDAATYLTDAEESAIWLPTEGGSTLRAYERTNSQANAAPLIELSIIDSQVGQVLRSGQPLRQSVFSGQGIKLKTDFFARAVLYVPLKLRGITLGVLGVSNVAAFRSFSKRDEFLLSILADYAAIALDNARVFQAADQALAARLEELSTLIEITRTITSSLDVDEVVQLTIQQVHNSWNMGASSLWWLDKNERTLRVISNIGTPSDVLTAMDVPVGEGFVGYVVETGKWIYTNDASSHPQHYRQIDQKTGFETRSLLCVPLVFRGEIVGAMQFLNKLDGEFDDLDVERALSIAAAVAIAITNARLFEEAESRKQQLETILEENRKQHAPASEALHDPLAEIGRLAEQLEQTGPLNAEQAQMTQTIAQTAARLMEMVPGLGDTAVTTPEPDPLDKSCDILDIVTQIVDEFQTEALGKRVALILTAEPDINAVPGNPAQLHQAISELIETAIQNSDADKRIEITILGNPNHVQIQIYNNGNEVKRVNGGFQEQSGESTAVTLTTAQSIAKAHGGQVWLETNNGSGSTLILRLPVSKPATP
ncbi:MAG: GAF domain-containing protein [Chloroflexi bacterium]|nr:GAF domain-containing protein [Chloroflexota bacterium]